MKKTKFLRGVLFVTSMFFVVPFSVEAQSFDYPYDPPVDPYDPPVDPYDPPVDPYDPPVDPYDPPVDPGITCTGACKTASEGCTAPEEPDNTGGCGTNSTRICCVVPADGGKSECELAGNRCARVTEGCVAPESPSPMFCASGRICCETPATGGTNECELVGGRCTTIVGGCFDPEVPSVRSCGSNSGKMCCDVPGSTINPNPNPNPGSGLPGGGSGLPGGGSGLPGGGSGLPGGGSGLPGGGSTTGSQCTGSKIGGVCFPSGTGLSEKSIVEILTSFISWILGIFGFIAILGFIISGLQYIFATGDEGMAETAKRNMKYSIIGIIVALSGWVIIKAVDAFLNASVWI